MARELWQVQGTISVDGERRQVLAEDRDLAENRIWFRIASPAHGTAADEGKPASQAVPLRVGRLSDFETDVFHDNGRDSYCGRATIIKDGEEFSVICCVDLESDELGNRWRGHYWMSEPQALPGPGAAKIRFRNSREVVATLSVTEPRLPNVGLIRGPSVPERFWAS
jgi:hypothetical protein